MRDPVEPAGIGGCNSPTGAHSRAMLVGRASRPRPAARFDLSRASSSIAAGSCSRPSARYHFRIEPRLKFEVTVMMIMMTMRMVMSRVGVLRHVPHHVASCGHVLKGALSAWQGQIGPKRA